ncbi:hypothetical protein ISN35_05770 [Xanthomonas translucens pv. undulosa]|uniref:hypothetical protein n=1 Tax=Xanthomonas translucens group TaxID=3390202 RepID=UPI000B1251DB|nr:hypothetical protein [Xanthomonas translucens]QSQ42062.1 hypothetical protein ISN33_02050 [Xanthomonas translucens pv. translucens]QSQ50092.1 hypothetical protein ISN35_05770 [Xanthomonas translucens pv. undulosa]QSQ52482.1 hypothetical protein ISN36_17800 [Xanthomonas translucens pv. undulosa]QSQ58598.1 hypothetical protein ISN38_09940 [Xanthomonas translucens pv. undulosa]UKE73468.1 hypothetical protein KFS85_00355 [Xanthomonas translucens pv. phleipratensis]
MTSESEGVGYIKFVGSAVEDGSIGADAAGNSLLALDELIRYFNRRQSKGFSALPYEITVKTHKGSWEVVVIGGVGIFVAAYIKKAAEKMAENDFADLGFKDVIRKSIDALRKLIDLVKHTKGNLDFSAPDLSWRVSEGSVGIKNSEGELMYVPLEYFQWYVGISSGLLKKLTFPIQENRSLIVASKVNGQIEQALITSSDKVYFGHENSLSEDEFLFPELEHGQVVELEGRLTRGNENTNSIGFEYGGHILNCVPEVGSIIQFKPALFLRCRIVATVTRLSKQHTEAERRPTLILKYVIPLETDDQPRLFER